MARPVEFDYEDVLQNAMEQFWKEGFEASSVQKLLDATGINRGTLYNSFGDKDAFFKSCVARYNSQLDGIMAATLGDSSLKADKAIAAFFDRAVVTVPPKQRQLGCLLVNSVCESIVWNTEIQKLLRDSLSAIRKAILARTRELEKSRALAKGLKADSAAEMLLTLYEGLNVAARSGKSPKVLAAQLEFTLKSLSR